MILVQLSSLLSDGWWQSLRQKNERKKNRAVVGRGSKRGGGMVNLVLDRFSLIFKRLKKGRCEDVISKCLSNLKENAPSKQVDLGMELKTEIRFGSH